MPRWIQALAGFITACGVIIGAVAALTGFISTSINSGVTERLDALESGLNGIKLDTTRLQLLDLIQNDPGNVEAILELADSYFIEQGGDGYMFAKFARWADSQGVDISYFRSLGIR